MQWYTKNILPRRLDAKMGSVDFNTTREKTVADARGVVLEIGFGSGYNLPFYKGVTYLYALEPSKELYAYAQSRIEAISFPITHLENGAENIPLSDHSVDAVISTWTLCSVSDLSATLKEVRRVLKPEGKFYFVEHGLSSHPFLKMLQAIVTTISRYFTGNCHLDRDIEKALLKANFSITRIEKGQEENRPLMFSYQGIAIAKKTNL